MNESTSCQVEKRLPFTCSAVRPFRYCSLICWWWILGRLWWVFFNVVVCWLKIWLVSGDTVCGHEKGGTHGGQRSEINMKCKGKTLVYSLLLKVSRLCVTMRAYPKTKWLATGHEADYTCPTRARQKNKKKVGYGVSPVNLGINDWQSQHSCPLSTQKVSVCQTSVSRFVQVRRVVCSLQGQISMNTHFWFEIPNFPTEGYLWQEHWFFFREYISVKPLNGSIKGQLLSSFFFSYLISTKYE